MTEKEIIDKLFEILRYSKNNNLEYAEAEFKNMSSIELDKPYEASSRTRREVLEGHRKERIEWHEIYNYVKDLCEKKRKDLGVELAREDNPLHADVIETFKGQLLTVFVKRLGGKVSIPVEEVDDTGMDLLVFNNRDGMFNFKIRKKT